IKLLEGAKLPLEGLSVENGCLLYKGKAWDCMSGSQQLIVDTAIASSLNPECKFVLLDKLEQLDLDTLADFDKWLTEKDLQCIATRVSTGDECTIVIEDGESEAGEGTVVVPKKPKKEDDADDWD
ncbi:MAG: chromosome segregation protein SMC, partial [Kiritimatiellae bacterium]|nr:chromosome segregation protein SMC [Kiritimatiellia bacterium]